MDVSSEQQNSFSELNKAILYSDEESTPPSKKIQSFLKKKQKIQEQSGFNLRESLNQIDDQPCLLTPNNLIQKQQHFDMTKTAKIKRRNAMLYQQICPICLNQYAKPRAKLQCKHQFCQSCLSEWIKTATACPCCRLKFNKYTRDEKETVLVQSKEMAFNQQDYFVCYVCGRGDNEHVLLICDACDFYCCHIYCDIELSNRIPQEDWYCRYCVQNLRANLQRNQNIQNDPNLDDTISSIESVSQKNVIANRTRSRARNENINPLQGIGGPVYRLRQLRRR